MIDINNSYNEITPNNVIIGSDNSVITEQQLQITPYDVIKSMADKLGQTIKEPKSNCKHCYGRGYIGRDSESHAPIPCSCIYSDDAKEKNDYMYQRMHHKSREERRLFERQLKSQMKKDKKRNK